MSTIGIPQNSTLNRVPKALVERKVRQDNKIKNVKLAKPIHQIQTFSHVDITYTQMMKAVPTNLFRNSGAKFSATLEQKSFYKLEDLVLKVQVTVQGADARLVGLPHWFNRIEIRAQNGSKHLNIIYADNLMFAFNMLDDNQLPYVKKLANMDDNWDPLPSITAGSTKTFYLPLLGSWIDTADLFFKNIEGDLIFDFYPESDIRMSGTGTIDVNTMEFLVSTEQLTDEDAKTQEKFNMQVGSEIDYLDVTPVQFYNHSLTANSQTKLELDSLRGEFAFLLLLIKQTGASNANNGHFEYVSLGENAKIDVLDPGSKSILGSGTGIDEQYLRNYVFSKHFRTDFSDKKSAYHIPFGGNSLKAFLGARDGSIWFDGSRNYLSITPDSSFTSANYDITIYGYSYRRLVYSGGRLTTSD